MRTSTIFFFYQEKKKELVLESVRGGIFIVIHVHSREWNRDFKCYGSSQKWQTLFVASSSMGLHMRRDREENEGEMTIYDKFLKQAQVRANLVSASRPLTNPSSTNARRGSSSSSRNLLLPSLAGLDFFPAPLPTLISAQRHGGWIYHRAYFFSHRHPECPPLSCAVTRSNLVGGAAGDDLAAFIFPRSFLSLSLSFSSFFPSLFLSFYTSTRSRAPVSKVHASPIAQE